MKRVAFGLLALVAVVGALAAGGDEEDGYRVRAIFDDAPTAVGSDVQIAGVTVGRVEAMDVTADHKAAITLLITDPRFSPMRADSRCGVIPQSLIGERTISCDPGTDTAAPLQRIASGPGEGEHLLPVERTSGSVDLDLVTSVMRRPASEQLAVLLTELGASVAARGPELAAVIRRANPALEETTRVAKILAEQADALERLAADGDAVLAPLARERRQLAAFVRGGRRTAAASASRREALARSLQKLPTMLAELRPLLADAERFAGEGTPLLRDLATAAPDLTSATKALEPFAREAGPAVERAGTLASRTRETLPRVEDLADRLGTLGTTAKPVTTDLDALTKSFAAGDGIENVLRLGYYGTSAANGFDDRGHYLRAQVLSGVCGEYSLKELFGCDSKFGQLEVEGESASASAASLADTDLLDYLLGPSR